MTIAYDKTHKPNTLADQELGLAAVGIDFKDEQERARFRQRVAFDFRNMKISHINRLLSEPKRSRYDATRQLAKEYMLRRRREGVW